MSESQKLLEIALAYKQLCEKHSLTYFICGGSAIGAVRHLGFIPWDDDIDFMMPRKDYETFIKIAQKELPYPFCLRDFSIDKEGYALFFAKIDRKDTTFIPEPLEKNHYRGGLYIDIFPMDGGFQNIILRKIHFWILEKIKSLHMLAFHGTTNNKSGIFRKIIVKFAKRFLKNKILFYTFHWILKLKHYKYSKNVGDIAWGYGEREVMAKDIFEPASKIMFENHYFSAPNKIDLYLQNIYGNYMKLPPKEERIGGHPAFYKNLKLPYEKFKYDI